jgi:hypothetical protein
MKMQVSVTKILVTKVESRWKCACSDDSVECKLVAVSESAWLSEKGYVSSGVNEENQNEALDQTSRPHDYEESEPEKCDPGDCSLLSVSKRCSVVATQGANTLAPEWRIIPKVIKIDNRIFKYGEKQNRRWLEYSDIMNRVYYFSCRSFSTYRSVV